MASVAPSAVQSTADAATNPAILKAQEATSAPKKSKEKKGKPVSAHPLEVLVHTHFSYFGKIITNVGQDESSARFLRSSYQNIRKATSRIQ